MDRREAITKVAYLLGGTIIGAELFVLQGCKSGPDKVAELFNTDNINFLDEVGETILPATSSPGAKAANIGQFMAVMVRDCYKPDDQQIFLKGITELNDACKKSQGKAFMDCDAKQRTALLTQLDKDQTTYVKTKKEADANQYFTMMKQLTILGYFTSEVGATKALRYVQIPGKYDGDYPYKKGDKAWALS